MKMYLRIFLVGMLILILTACKPVVPEDPDDEDPDDEDPIEDITWPDYSSSLKILAIGNSFSDDAMEYIWQIADDYGIEEIILGNLYIGGAELDLHFNNLVHDRNAYAYRKNTSGTWITTNNVSISTALAEEDWDIITVQQVSGKSGFANTYNPSLNYITQRIYDDKTNPDALIAWHMTWAYESTSNHGDFNRYDRDQMTMYNAIVESTQSVIPDEPFIDFVIPAGTAIQNLRTSYLGDKLTRDGYHLNHANGRYTAALMWFKQITQFEIDDIEYRPSGVTELDLEAAKEAVNHAYETPYAVTNSTYTEGPEPDENNVSGIAYTFEYVQGFWASNANDVSPETDALHNSFVAVLPIAKESLPVGSEIVIEAGYQYRIIYLEETVDGYQVLLRTDQYTTPYVVVDEAFWGDYAYVAFNISPTGSTTDISDRLHEVANTLKLYHPEGTPLHHVDLPLSFVSGYWNNNATAVTPGIDDFSRGFAASNVLSKTYLDDVNKIIVAEGYQIRVIFLTFSSETGYLVVQRTNNFTGTILTDDDFWGDYQYVAFNISSVPSSDLSSVLATLPEKLDFDTELIDEEEVNFVHEDEDLSYILGYWNDGQTEVTTSAGNSVQFIASNVVSRTMIPVGTVLQIEAGYQVRAVFLSFSPITGYRVLARSSNFTGEVVLSHGLYKDYQYIAFNISKVPTSDISGEIEDVATKLTTAAFTDDLVPHENTELTFVTGYWDNNALAVTTGTTDFIKGFAASNVLSKDTFVLDSTLEIASGYQVRVVFLDYSYNQYVVLNRTDNLTGELVLDADFWGNYQYVAFNISSVPSSDLSESLETLPALLAFTEPDIIDDLTFESGFWGLNASAITPGDTAFNRQFAASNIYAKSDFGVGTTAYVASGYQVRVIFLTYDETTETYTVVFRTDNLIGAIEFDETLWGEYGYVAFNISTTPTRELTAEEIPDLPEKLLLVKVN